MRLETPDAEVTARALYYRGAERPAFRTATRNKGSSPPASSIRQGMTAMAVVDQPNGEARPSPASPWPHRADAAGGLVCRQLLEMNLDAVLPTHLNRSRDIQRTRGDRVSQRLEHLDSVTSSPSGHGPALTGNER